jgi:large subunit ribosomal protein L35
VSFTSNVGVLPNNSVLSHPEFLKLSANPTNFTQVRTVTKYSLRKGKRRSVKAVLKRFMRLDWGIWIRTKTGRHKRIWKKSQHNRRRAKQHVFTNSQQSMLLDKMVTNFWRKPRHYVDDPYEFYHKRENHWSTRKKPIDWDL